jgi:hypothetical protein
MEDHSEDHNVSNLTSLASDAGNFCSVHKEKITKHCSTCNITICFICEKIKHHNHNVSFMDEFYRKIKNELNSVKMPCELTTSESFVEIFSEEENLFLQKVKNGFEEIRKNISELAANLNDVNLSLQIKEHY